MEKRLLNGGFAVSAVSCSVLLVICTIVIYLNEENILQNIFHSSSGLYQNTWINWTDIGIIAFYAAFNAIFGVILWIKLMDDDERTVKKLLNIFCWIIGVFKIGDGIILIVLCFFVPGWTAVVPMLLTGLVWIGVSSIAIHGTRTGNDKLLLISSIALQVLMFLGHVVLSIFAIWIVKSL